MGHEGELICDSNVAITCDAEGQPEAEEDCGIEVCVPGTGCVLCIDGQYSCFGNSVRSCNPGSPPTWETIATCNPMSNQRCNSTLGICESMQPIGNGSSSPTGQYFQYATFVQGSSAFLGGCDVDSYGNYIYVNRGNWYVDGQYLDVYMVEILDSDQDGTVEPNQHPDNPDAPGPIEERVLTLVTTYNVPHLGMVHHAEVYATADRVFLLDAPSNPGNLYEYVFGTGVTTAYIDSPTPAVELAQLGYDELTDTWYASSEAARKVYSYHAPSNAWVAEFLYPNLAGGHMDGMEVVVDPNTQTSYVYVSDMTSDYLGQYKRERGGGWVQVNLFEYVGTGGHVEGMGFGAYNHFWITSGTDPGQPPAMLYEIGGGDLQKYTEPNVPPT